MIKTVNLLCNDSVRPLGIDDPSPFFSWQATSDIQNQHQTAYQIIVTKSDFPNETVWDTEKVSGSECIGISYCGTKLTPMTGYFWKVRQWDKNGNPGEWSENSYFETGLMGKYKGQWIGAYTDSKTWRKPDPLPAPMLRKSFVINGQTKKARVYVCGLGYHLLFINGRKVSDRILSPAVSQYNERVYYETLDITDYLTEGENVFGVILGNGWYNSYTKDPWNFAEAPWRDRPKLCLECYIELENGETLTVLSDSTWKSSDGPIVADGLRHGEVYDARLERDGWSSSGFDDSEFLPVQIKRSPGGLRCSWQATPIRKVEMLKAVKIYRHKDGTCIYDFGKNISGYIRLSAKGYRNAEIVFRYSERIDESYKINREKIAAYIYSGEFQTDRYIMRGNKKEEWTPSFTYHGFRYVEISGYPGEYTEDTFTADVIHTDFASHGEFECSDETINKIQGAARLSTLTNFHGLPEDCPHREKNGWTGDAWISAEQLLLNFDSRRDYRKWISDLRDCQRPDGHLPGLAPTAAWGYRRTGIIWGAALLFIPWYQYLYYADKKIIAENYDAIKKFIENTASLEVEGTVTHDGENPYSFGDWMPPGGNNARKCSVVLMETATYYLMLSVFSKMAEILGKNSDSEFYRTEAQRIKKCFNKKYVKDNALTVKECMTANACLSFHGLDENGIFLNKLKAESEANGGIADFGFHGLKYVLHALTDNGLEDVAYKIVKNKKYPGWGYMVDSGATTLWETWEGDLSQNHHALSDVSAYFYKALGGIRVDEGAPGFKHFFLKPFAPPDISFARASHLSPYGKIESSWERTVGGITYRCTVPVNTEATLVLFDKSEKRLGSGRYEFFVSEN